jgi:hypothetical protein
MVSGGHGSRRDGSLTRPGGAKLRAASRHNTSSRTQLHRVILRQRGRSLASDSQRRACPEPAEGICAPLPWTQTDTIRPDKKPRSRLNLAGQRAALSSLACIRWSATAMSAKSPAPSQGTREGQGTRFCMVKAWPAPMGQPQKKVPSSHPGTESLEGRAPKRREPVVQHRRP